MAESNATERLETCVRHHSRTCTCGINEPLCQECGQPTHSPGDCYAPGRAMRPLREPELLLALRGEVASHLTCKLAAEHLGISAQWAATR